VGTHTQTYSHRGQKQFQDTSRMLAKGWRVPGLIILLKRVTEIKATSFIPTTSKTDNVNILVLT